MYIHVYVLLHGVCEYNGGIRFIVVVILNLISKCLECMVTTSSY